MQSDHARTPGSATWACARQLAGARTFTELLSHAGLKSPFDEACLREVCQTAQALAGPVRPDGDGVTWWTGKSLKEKSE